MPLKKIVFVVGPTAVGKSQVAFHLAQKLNGEIISCDSMQVYKEISIASNKTLKTLRKAVRHHLIDIVSIAKSYDAAAFRQKALKTIDAIHKKGKIPIVAGGTGLYMSILLDGIFKGGQKSVRLRQQLEREAKQKGEEALYQKLQKMDLESAAKIHPHNTRKIIRALEVVLKSKRPISKLQKERKGLWGQYAIDCFALSIPRERLYERINQRVDQMFAHGIVDEIKCLERKKWSPTAKGIIGFKEIKGYLDGIYDLERAKYLMKLNTRHYAKRQMTWFRKDKRLSWIAMEDNDTPVRVAEKIVQYLK
ncbi:MAG: tRNA (adenosine(37)-N6)-dimethylallyltransferase MiaA [Candidatus Omnitrophota bacterium]